MRQQIDLTFNTLPEPPSGLDPAPAPHDAPRSPHRTPHWLERIELFLRVLLRMYVGLFLCWMPWSHRFWDQNPIFLQYPSVATIAAMGAVRGLVTGLGLLNLWIAFQDAIRYRDR